jgi:hypothetical protein
MRRRADEGGVSLTLTLVWAAGSFQNSNVMRSARDRDAMPITAADSLGAVLSAEVPIARDDSGSIRGCAVLTERIDLRVHRIDCRVHLVNESVGLIDEVARAVRCRIEPRGVGV